MSRHRAVRLTAPIGHRQPRIMAPARTRATTNASLPVRVASHLLFAKPAHVRPEVSGDAGLPPYASLSHATGPARRELPWVLRPVWRGRGPGPS